MSDAASKGADGHLNKSIIKDFIEFGCDRQLFWHLGVGDARWMDPPRKPARGSGAGMVRKPDLLLQMGRAYEQDVYARLLHSPLDVRCAQGSHERVVTASVRPQDLRACVADLRQNNDDALVLLEHEWATPAGLLRWILDLPDDASTIPIANPSQYCRPDITIIEQTQGVPGRALTHEGIIEAVGAEDDRVALRVLDVKHTNPEDIGKKQFIELLFYAHSLAIYLDVHDLTDLMYVSIDGLGIWPVLNLNRIRLSTIDDIGAAIVEMEWDNHAHLFMLARDKIRELGAVAPIRVEDVELLIQPACARCRYIADCKASLGWADDLEDLAEVDVRLLPGTAASTAEQLRDLGIDTVRDLHQRVDELADHTSLVPSPLYAERELLGLKAQAMIANEKVLPDKEQAQRRHMTMALPNFSDVVMTFNAEADPTNDCVFAFGTHIDIRCHPNSPLAPWHTAWWTAWHKALDQHWRVRDVDTGRILDEVINPELFDYFLGQRDEMTPAQLRRRILTKLNLFAEILFALNKRGDFSVRLDPEHQDLPLFRHEHAFVSQGTDPLQERALANEMVRQFQLLVSLSAIYEEMVGAVRPSQWKDKDAYVIAPTSAILYWSRDQLEHVQELMERHLTHLMTDPDICVEFHELLQLINPAESSVQRDYLHKKIYDLRVFAETCVGLPQIINYTWHEIARQELPYDIQFSSKYWAPNFNYMDFLAWHEYLGAQNPAAVKPLLEQTGLKARIIGQLGRSFQGMARKHQVVTERTRPIPSHSIEWRAGLVRPEYNFLARVWALYSKLTASVQAQEALTARLNYPDYAIGKLSAAEVSNLNGTIDDDGHQRLRFELAGISSNVKLSEGDYVLLVHEDRRDASIGQWSGEHVIIDEMEWDAPRQRYVVVAHARSDNHPFFEETPRTGHHWYIYPSSADFWSTKLFEGKNDTLYRRYALGTSWLGTRMAYLLDLLPAADAVPTRPEGYDFDLAQAYMYAPSLLPHHTAEPQAPLVTPCAPAPDDSQRRAIHTALASTVSCIQGPPGTGKSQTIAALIDEYLTRHDDRPVKILVASCSYVPLQVVAEKILDQVDDHGAPTRAARCEKVFLRSKSRGSLGLPGVRDLYRDSGKMILDGEAVPRSRGSQYKDGYMRLEDQLGERCIIFGPAQQLFYLGAHSSSKSMDFDWLHNDFGFDLIIIDEASQMPVDQALTSICLTRRGAARMHLDGDHEGKEQIEDRAQLKQMTLEAITDHQGEPMPDEALTKFVIVGDHNQLPPVQPVEVSQTLRPILGSFFEYMVRHHGVPSHQLGVNYRSRPEIVGYTRHLGLYEEGIEAYHSGAQAYAPLAAPPEGVEPWIAEILEDSRVVTSIIHTEEYKTAISPLEADLVAKLVEAFYLQMRVTDVAAERAFWREHVGIVAPHNAQGRLIIRSIAERMMAGKVAQTSLSGAELEELLRNTIYTVEKFQGSARTFIIASMGISARNQLAAEETFIYDVNRLNVLTSRARQKMLMLCSQIFLDYTPRHREVVAAAARSRDYALVYCNRETQRTIFVDGLPHRIRTRWHDPGHRLATVPRPMIDRPDRHPDEPVRSIEERVASLSDAEEQQLRAALKALGLEYDTLPPQQLATFAAQVLGMQKRYANDQDA